MIRARPTLSFKPASQASNSSERKKVFMYHSVSERILLCKRGRKVKRPCFARPNEAAHRRASARPRGSAGAAGSFALQLRAVLKHGRPPVSARTKSKPFRGSNMGILRERTCLPPVCVHRTGRRFARRRQVIEDMQLRCFSPRTQPSYARAVRPFDFAQGGERVEPQARSTLSQVPGPGHG